MTRSLPVLALRGLMLVLPMAAAGHAVAGPKCTEEPQTRWLTAEQMTKKFQAQGYRDDVKKLHVSKGNCWEIYGHDQAGRKVEIYFHPISGEIAEANVKD